MSRTLLLSRCTFVALLAAGASPVAAQQAPQLAIDLASASWLSGITEWRGERPRLTALDGQAGTTLFRVSGLDAGTALRGQYDRLADGSTYARAQADVRFSTRSPLRGVSIGAGVSAASAPRYRFATTTARVGGWVRALGLSMSGELTAGHLPVLVSGGDSLVLGPFDTLEVAMGPRRARRVGSFATEARVSMSTRVAGIQLDGYAGHFLVRRGSGSAYGAFTATQWISPRLAVMAGAAFRPVDPGSGLGRQVALFGLRVAPRGTRSRAVDAPPTAATGLAVTRTGEDVTITLHAPGASSVEIAGDFTRWNAVALTPGRGDRWTFTTNLRPGVYRVHVRVDLGAWAPPPGVSRAVDPYEGTVGVLVVS